MDQYQDAQGQTRSGLSLIQSMLYNILTQFPAITKNLPGRIEVLSRKQQTPTP